MATDPGECVDLAADEVYSDKLKHWREKLVAVLSKRNIGLTHNDTLVCQAGNPPIVSPKYKERLAR